MSIDAVSRLNAALEGRYRVEREIGEGGMATVYLADDVKHERKVALKVLKPELAAVVGADRFLAEIKTTANLQHPHILPLFDSGQAGSFLFYVMPYIEGETLAIRIAREKQLPVDEAVGIGVAVANALQTAHDAGVVHRDIKPGNILLSRGQPLVADFGIALAVGAAGGNRLTETGLSIGTPYYMSPEQATGDQQLGPPSDTYALAAVLCEMLTGDPPYLGSTAQAVLGQILTGDPVSPRKKRPAIPANVDAAIRKALERLPADRFTRSEDFARALADPSFQHGQEGAAAGVDPAATARLKRTAYAGWATAAVAAIGFAVMATREFPEPVRHVERFAVPFLPGQTPTYLGAAGYNLSPDGTMLVYRLVFGGADQILMVRRWDDLAATPVRESVGAANPSVSPDGLELAFDRGDEIRALALGGGPVRTIASGDNPHWGPDGFIYFTTPSGTARVPANGGPVEELTRLSEGEARHEVYDVLPGAEWALLEVDSPAEATSQIHAVNLGNGESKRIVAGGRPRFAASGHLVFSVAGTIMAARFDPKEAELLGTPIAIMSVGTYWSLSHDGKLFYTTSDAGFGGADMSLAWVDRSGNAEPVDPDGWRVTPGPSNRQGWSISHQGSMIAVRHWADQGWDIWVKRLTGARSFSRLTFDDADDVFPVWHPDGETVTFLSTRGGNQDVWSRRADGTGEPELLLDLEQTIQTAEWTPDGQYLLLRIASATGEDDLVAVRVGAEAEPVPIATTAFYEEGPVVSPDGRWVAYSSDETGRGEIYVHPFPDVGSGRWQVSSNGGRNPRWAHSGGELFFEGPGPNRSLMVVEVRAEPTFEAGVPRELFPMSGTYYGSAQTGMVYRVAPDDQRFLLATDIAAVSGDGEEAPTTVLVNNFFSILEQMVPRS